MSHFKSDLTNKHFERIEKRCILFNVISDNIKNKLNSKHENIIISF